MGAHALIYFSAASFFLGVIFLPAAQTSPSNYYDDEDLPTDPMDEYNDFDDHLNRISYVPVKRDNCTPRGGNCDHRRNECCESTSCRCNLWGANCRCQTRGLFQKWGK